MEVFTTCVRCGKPVAMKRYADNVFDAQTAPALIVARADDKRRVFFEDGSLVAAICPDCTKQLKEWLIEAPGERQVPGKSADGDSVEKLAADMSKVVLSAMTGGEDGNGMTACRYFGRRGVPCEYGGTTCPAYGPIGMTCVEFAPRHLRRRCEALGIDLDGGEEDAER